MKSIGHRNRKILAALSSLLILILVFGCNPVKTKAEKAEENVAEAKENVAEAKENVAEAKENLEAAEEKYAVELIEMRIEAKNKAIENEKSIAEIKTKIEKGDSTKRAELKKKITELEVTNEQLKQKIAAYQMDKGDDWTQFKANFKKDMDELGRSLKGFTAEPRQ